MNTTLRYTKTNTSAPRWVNLRERFNGTCVFWITALVACSGRTTTPPVANVAPSASRDGFVLSHPHRSSDTLVDVRMSAGQQKTIVIERCGEAADDRAWKAGLERDGFVVEISNYEVQVGDGKLYAMRFRRGRFYGDLVLSPRGNCQTHTFRFQHSADASGRPEKWRIPFLLGEGDDVSPDVMGRSFRKDPAFPPGYP